MAVTSSNGAMVTRREARNLDRRLRGAVATAERYGIALTDVIQDSLTPDDLATLEMFCGLVRERARNATV